MKPPPFEYEAPESLCAALHLLAEHGDDAKVLAGGQSLVPLLNMRLARPALLIDVNRIGELGHLTRRKGRLHLGTLTRQVSLERSPLVARHWPLLREAAAWIAHPQIRARGTVGGSVAHADASAEIPTVLAALDAEFVARSAHGERTMCWRDFFRGPFETDLRGEELLTEVRVPALPPHTGTAFAEFARRRGDFAIAGVAAVVTLDTNGTCRNVAVALLGLGPVPLRAPQVEEALAGRVVDEPTAADAADALLGFASPFDDLHADATHRREVAAALVRRTLLRAARRAERRPE